MIHKLKIEAKYFEEVCTGKKTFEIRKNDRNFLVGDKLLLQEFLPLTQKFTGRAVERKITYITDYAQQGNYVVMAVDKVEEVSNSDTSKIIKTFLQRLDTMSGTGNGIGKSTVEKVKDFAKKEGFII